MELYHVTLKRNLKSIMKYGLIPQVGERSAKLNEELGVFLFPSVEDMELALEQWLGDEFDEEEELISLKVFVPDDFPLEEPVEYERVVRTRIPPEWIEFFREE